MTRCESYPPCFGTIYFPTAPYSFLTFVSFPMCFPTFVLFFLYNIPLNASYSYPSGYFLFY